MPPRVRLTRGSALTDSTKSSTTFSTRACPPSRRQSVTGAAAGSPGADGSGTALPAAVFGNGGGTAGNGRVAAVGWAGAGDFGNGGPGDFKEFRTPSMVRCSVIARCEIDGFCSASANPFSMACCTSGWWPKSGFTVSSIPWKMR